MAASSSFAKEEAGSPIPALGAIDAVLFDLDGTLVEPGIDFRAMHRRVLDLGRAAGHDLPIDSALPTLEAMRVICQGLAARSEAAAQRFACEAAAAIEAIEIDAAGRVSPYAGVPAMLHTLRSRGIRVGIVTRNCRAAVEALLARCPLEHDVLLTRDDVPHVKPHPDHLRGALDLLGARAERSLMVGDHAMDVVAGRAVGALTVGVVPTGAPAGAFDHESPDLLLASAADLGLVLERAAEGAESAKGGCADGGP